MCNQDSFVYTRGKYKADVKKAPNKLELSEYAKSITPEEIKVKLVEHDNLLSLHLKWKGSSWRYASRHLISLDFTKDDLDQRIHDEILEKLKGKIKKVILEFGKDQCDYLIDRFGLSEVYREIHEEKNIRVYQKILLVGI
jgi:hypothetical protein